MTPEQKVAAARDLQENPLYALLMDELEMSAINACVNAKPVEHDERAAAAAEVRAIRNFRRKLNLLTEEAKADAKGAPA